MSVCRQDSRSFANKNNRSSWSNVRRPQGNDTPPLEALNEKPVHVKANALHKKLRTSFFSFQCVQLEQSLAKDSQLYRAWARHSLGWRQALPRKPVNLADWLAARPHSVVCRRVWLRP